MANFFEISDSLPHMHQSKHTLQNKGSITSILLIPLLKTLTLILSFTVLSLFFWHPSWARFSHLVTFSWQFVSHGADKNYIFLLCNGLLVIVAKYSYWTLKTHSVPFSSSYETITASHEELGYDPEPSTDLQAQFCLGKTALSSHISYWESYSSPDQTEPSHLVKDAVTVKKEITDCNHKGEDELVSEDYRVPTEEQQNEVDNKEDDDEEYYDEEGENAKMSTEELNRKIEEFIRRRKEELRIEAQQLIVVYD